MAKGWHDSEVTSSIETQYRRCCCADANLTNANIGLFQDASFAGGLLCVDGVVQIDRTEVSTGGAFSTDSAVIGSCPGIVVTACHVRVAGPVFDVTADCC